MNGGPDKLENSVTEESVSDGINEIRDSEEIHQRIGSVNGFYQDIIRTSKEKHSAEYEYASTKLKEQESKLMEAETKLKYQETYFKEAQVVFKEKESLLKDEDVQHRKQETLLKEQDVKLKTLECLRYEQETKHQEGINKCIETTLRLRNLQIRLDIIHEIGLKFDGNSDFDTLLEMSELLGDPIPESVVSSLKPINSKIIKNKEVRTSVYR